MGYSISVNCKSHKARDKMEEFLKKNFRSWNLVSAGKGDPDNAFMPDDGDLSYARGKCQIGFDYNSCLYGLERDYYYTVLKWIAIQVGKPRKKFFADHPTTFDNPVPGIVYDGYDHWPVLLKKPGKKLLWCWVDKLGMKRDLDAAIDEHVNELWLFKLVVPVRNKKGQWALRDDAEKLIIKWRAEAGKPDEEAYSTKEERHRLVKELLGKELQESLSVIRNELQRLDDLWRAA